MNRAIHFLPALLACASLAACMTDGDETNLMTQASETVTLSGQLSYRERIALLPGSTATVSLEDVSRADAPSTVIASETIELGNRQVPVPFQLAVDDGQLSERSRYSLRATISGPDGALAWTTDTAMPVEKGSGDRDFGMITLVSARGSAGSNATGETVYVCGDARIRVAASAESAAVTFDGRQMTLPRVPSASGEKYESGTAGSPEYAMLWLRGDRAQFQWGSRRFPECERQAM